MMIIVDASGQFWDGSSWCDDYSEAKEYEDYAHAVHECNALLSEARVISEYGLVSEEEVYSNLNEA